MKPKMHLRIVFTLLTLTSWSFVAEASDPVCEKDLSGVSVPEADRVNAFHNCQGCSKHRWISKKQLRPEDFRNMYNFGVMNNHRIPLYPCRVFLKTEIAIGQYNHQEGTCSVGYNLTERKYSSWFQVLTIPGGLEQESFDTGNGVLYKYELINVKSVPKNELWNIAVLAGQLDTVSSNGDGKGYIAFGKARYENCNESVIGKIWRGDSPYPIPRAYFPVCGKEVKSYKFDVLVCKKYLYY